MEERDPQLLWRRIGAGDRRAFTALYERYEDDVVRFCRALLRDGDDAREAANSTWASVWHGRAAAQRDVELRPWLFRIAHNEAVDILRRRRSHEPLDAGLAGPADPVAEAELNERLALLRADLMALSDHQRTALVLRELSGMGHEEIGAVLGVSAGAAKQTIYEARRALIDAEGGRSLACDLVRSSLADGDRRVLRGRRLRAHLRSCAACRELADAGVERRRRELGVLLPGPLAWLAARIAPEVALGGGATGAVVGGRLAAPLLAKVATSAAVGVAVAVGASAAPRGSQDHAPVRAHSVVVAPPLAHVVRAAAVPRTKPPRPAAPQATFAHRHARRVRPEASAASRGRAVARPAVAPAAVAPVAPTRAGAAAKPVPPGQAKRGATTSPSAAAPGQLKKAEQSSSVAPPAAAPGQVKKADQSAGTTADPAPAAALPPGQAKRQADDPAALPPGQAKRQG